MAPLKQAGIMHTYHGRHVVATRPRLLTSSDAIGREFYGAHPGLSLVQRSSVDAITVRDNHPDCQVTWPRPYSAWGGSHVKGELRC